MILRLKFIIFYLILPFTLFSNNNFYEIGNVQNVLKIVKFDNAVIFTGLKNKGVFKLNKNGDTVKILSSDITVKNIFENNNKLFIETLNSYYLYNNDKVIKISYLA